MDLHTKSSQWLARGLVGLIASVLCSLGAMAVMTSEHTGRTRQGAIVFLEGGSAQLFGWLLIVLGLLPIAIIFNTRHAKAKWLWMCLIVGLAGSIFTYLR
jgi:Na+/melibiose symporter-like transporter